MRHLISSAAALAFAASLGAPALAQDAPVEQQLSLTVYNSNIALVQDIRPIDLKAGRTRVEFKGVSGEIRPETVSLSAPGVGVVEQNFDFDLLTPAKMMEKAVGRQVRIVRYGADGKQVTETATVLSVNDGVILRIGDHIEVLHDGGEPTQVLFDSIPENLRAQPTLSVTMSAAAAGKRNATLSYMTGGLSWKADYVALFDEKRGTMDLQGWVTLTNNSGVTYRDAKTQLVAGEVNLVNNDWEWQQRYRRGSTTSAGTGGGEGNPIADYYLYPLPERVTVANNQTKQVGFLSAAAVPARKVYRWEATSFSSQTAPEHAKVMIEFSNAKDGTASMPMPAGILRIYVRDQEGEPKFIGENRVDHTPVGSQLAVQTGEAFDVTVQGTVVSANKINAGRTRYSMDYVVKNARPVPVTVELAHVGLGRDGKVDKESQPSRRLDAQTLSWDVEVPANGEKHLTFTVEAGW